MNISEGDIADFKMVIKRNDESINDYTLEFINNYQDNKDEIEGYFLVTRKSIKFNKKYDAGPGNLWLNYFENDLKNGVFKS